MQASLLGFFVGFVVSHDKFQHARTTVGIIHEIKKSKQQKKRFLNLSNFWISIQSELWLFYLM